MRPEFFPYALITFRFFAGPAILLLAFHSGLEARYWCTSVLALGVLSDIFDGVIARRLKCASPALRKLDSKADVVFWITATAAVVTMRPDLIRSLLPMAAVLFALEFIAPIISFARFGQEASTHHITSKIFGLGLWFLLSVLFIAGEATWLQLSVFALGVASQVEAIAIMLTIPSWQTDIRSLKAAIKLRNLARR